MAKLFWQDVWLKIKLKYKLDSSIIKLMFQIQIFTEFRVENDT